MVTLSNDSDGFKKKHSYETQLLITLHDLANILNKQSQADVVVLHFIKVFDKVPHHHLLINIKYYYLNQQVIGCIESFLSSQTKIVVVDGYTSQEVAILSGVNCKQNHIFVGISSFIYYIIQHLLHCILLACTKPNAAANADLTPLSGVLCQHHFD